MTRRTPSSRTAGIRKQMDQMMNLTEELRRTLRGHNGSPGLVTELALLHKETTRLRTALESHLEEHAEERRGHRVMRSRISERVVVWALIGILYFAAVGGAAVIFEQWQQFSSVLMDLQQGPQSQD